jgi:predicted ATPase
VVEERLFGRSTELQSLAEAVSLDRLVTVHGPLGVGKSALLRAFREAAVEPVALFDLAQSGAPLPADLPERGLIVLDGAEAQLELLRERLTAWQRERPLARWIVGSRCVLGLENERVFPLPPLSKSAALELFRARSASAKLAPGAALDTALEQLLERLDQLPLAIELAAARVRHLAVSELLESGDSLLELLRVGAVDLKQRLLVHVERLDAEAALVLAAVSWFRGGFSLDVALGVLPEFDRPHVVDGLSRLMDAGLVLVEESNLGRRYRLLELVRQLGIAERRKQGGQLHATTFLALVCKNKPEQLELEPANLRAAFEYWCATEEFEHACSVVLAWNRVVRQRDSAAERVKVLSELVDRGAEGKLAIGSLTDLLLARAEARGQARDASGASADRKQALALARDQRDDRVRLGRALCALGRQLWHEGELDQAEAHYREALASLVDRDAEEEMLTWSNLANIHVVRGALEQARAEYETALMVAARGAVGGEALGLVFGNLGNLELNLGETSLALYHLDEAVKLLRVAGAYRYIVPFLGTSSRIALSQGLWEQARALAEEARIADARLTDWPWRGDLQMLRGELYEADGEQAAARREMEAGVEALRLFGHPLLCGLALAKLARLECLAGRAVVAQRRLTQAAEALGTERPLCAIVSVVQAHLELRDGKLEEAVRLANQVEADAERNFEVRCALQRVRGLLELTSQAAEPAPPLPSPPTSSAPSATAELTVDKNGRWFSVRGGKRVEFTTRRALRLVLVALTDAAVDAPGRALSVEVLFELGWPGERAHPEAAQARVYNAIAELRRSGLRELLVRRDDGYLFVAASVASSLES